MEKQRDQGGYDVRLPDPNDVVEAKAKIADLEPSDGTEGSFGESAGVVSAEGDVVSCHGQDKKYFTLVPSTW